MSVEGNEGFLEIPNASLRVSGNVHAEGIKLGVVELIPSYEGILEIRNATIRATSNLEIGTANLFVDTTTGRVGIGTNAPMAALDVRGGITKTLYNPGEVIEELNSICDGSVVVVKSGSYTMADVTVAQNATLTHTEVTGSAISYTPPPGTKRVYYRFWFHWDSEGLSGISHFKPQINGNDIYAGARNIASQFDSASSHGNFPISIEYTIDCNATTTDPNAGKFTSWTIPKTLRVMFREYTGTYQCRVHANQWWDGSGAAAPYIVAKPHLTIRAIA
jgi:hypothetical protein